jgi:hypothetical protein
LFLDQQVFDSAFLNKELKAKVIDTLLRGGSVGSPRTGE